MNNEPTQNPNEDPSRPPHEQDINNIEMPSLEPANLQPTALPIIKQKSKKPLIITLIVVVLVALGGGGAYAYYLMNQPVAAPAPAPVVSASATPTPKPLTPYALVYADVITDSAQNSYSPNTTIYQKQLDGSEALASLKLQDYHGVGATALQGDKVAIAELLSSTSKNQVAIYVSSDSGTSYTKLYDIAKGEDVTSQAFASDGKSLVVGSSMAAVQNKNTIKQIDLTTKKATDLFSIDKSGVYIAGVDSSKAKIYYYKNCYGCDGVREGVLYAYDTKTKATDTILNTTTSNYGTTLNSDYSKGVRMQIISSGINQAMASKPETATVGVEEFDVATKKETQLAKLDYPDDKYGFSGQEPVGYTSDGQIYYAFNNTVNVIDKDGKSRVLLDAGKLVSGVYFVSKDFVVYKTESFNSVGSSSSEVLKYDIATKKSTSLFKYAGFSPSIIGVTLKRAE